MRLGAVVGSLVWPLPREAQNLVSSEPIQFAGIAYLDDSTRFPVSRALRDAARQNGIRLEKVLQAALRRAGVSLQVDDNLATSRRTTALALAFESEYRVQERYDGGITKTTTVITGQLLAIDFETQVVKISFPFLYEYVDAPGRGRPMEDVRAIAARILPAFVDTTQAGVFQDLVSAVQGLPSITARCSVRITAIRPDTVTQRVGAARFGADSARLIASLASAIGGQLIASAGLPLLPFSIDKARAQLQARFDDGEIFNLGIPESDYNIVIDDFRTRRATVGQNASRRVDATRIQYALQVTYDGRPIARGEFRLTQLDTVPVGKTSSDSWGDILAVTKGLTASVGINTLARNERWFRTNDLSQTAFPALPDWLFRQCVDQP